MWCLGISGAFSLEMFFTTANSAFHDFSIFVFGVAFSSAKTFGKTVLPFSFSFHREKMVNIGPHKTPSPFSFLLVKFVKLSSKLTLRFSCKTSPMSLGSAVS